MRSMIKTKNDYAQFAEFYKLLSESTDKVPSFAEFKESLKSLAKLTGIKEEIIPCFVQKAYQGNDCTIIKEGNIVTMINQEGKNIEGEYPDIVKAVKSMKEHKFIIEAILEACCEKKTIAHCVDLAWDPFKNINIQASSFGHRYGIFNQMEFAQSSLKPNIKESCLNFAPTSFVSNIEELDKAFKYFSDENNSVIVRFATAVNETTFMQKIKESKHSREKCMVCEAKPELEVKWAEGMAHAWFCKKDYKIWAKEHVGDIDYVKIVKDGIASKQFKDNPNPNIFKASHHFVLQHHWWLDPAIEQFDLRLNIGKPEMLHATLQNNIIEVKETAGYINTFKETALMKKGTTVEKINEANGITSWISIFDKGRIKLLENTETKKRIEFFGKKLKGKWTATREKESATLWNFKKESD